MGDELTKAATLELNVNSQAVPPKSILILQPLLQPWEGTFGYCKFHEFPLSSRSH